MIECFPDHTVETAPERSRRSMEATEQRLGYLPSAIARLATSPHLLEGFLKLSGMFEATTLDALARETVVMTIAYRNGCHLCIAMHTAKLRAVGADDTLVEALRAGLPLDDERLEAVRAFTIEVIERSGDVDDETLNAFLSQGFTAQNALEVVLGIGTYTMSTFANRLTGAPIDEPLAAFA